MVYQGSFHLICLVQIFFFYFSIFIFVIVVNFLDNQILHFFLHFFSVSKLRYFYFSTDLINYALYSQSFFFFFHTS